MRGTHKVEFNRRPSRPAPRATRAADHAPQSATQASNSGDTRVQHNTPSAPRPESSSKKRIVVIALMTLVLLSAGLLLGKYLPLFGGENGRVDSSKNQAVFLTNDQVYFGKIIAIDDDVVVMKDIYYLQKGAGAADSKDATNPAEQANMSLAKLGNELHGPEDVMHINKSQVLFWENLKEDGKVSKAIEDYQK